MQPFAVAVLLLVGIAVTTHLVDGGPSAAGAWLKWLATGTA